MSYNPFKPHPSLDCGGFLDEQRRGLSEQGIPAALRRADTRRSGGGPRPGGPCHSEKATATTGKVVCNGLPPDEWGEAMPIRASFRHAYGPEIVQCVLGRWGEYGFAQHAIP